MPARVTSSGTVTCRSISSAEAPFVRGHHLDDGRGRIRIGFHVDMNEGEDAEPREHHRDKQDDEGTVEGPADQGTNHIRHRFRDKGSMEQDDPTGRPGYFLFDPLSRVFLNEPRRKIPNAQ